MAAAVETDTSRGPSGQDYVYTGPGTTGGRYIRTFWHPVAIASDLAAGDAKPISFLGEQFTLYRGEGGTPHVVAFRCAHRLSQLSTGWVEGDGLRCVYHGWKYDQHGQCVDQPAEPEPFCDRIRIRAYPTQEYLGLVFGYFGGGDPPPLPRYPAFEREGILIHHSYIRHCNFFNNVDNDPIHVYFAHSRHVHTHARNWRRDPLPRVSTEETPYGIAHISTWQDTEMPRVTMTYHLIPAITYRVSAAPRPGSEDDIAWRVPIDDVTHGSFGVRWVNRTGADAEEFLARRQEQQRHEGDSSWEVAAQVLAGTRSMHTIPLERTDLTSIEDDVTQVGQGVLPDRSQEHLGATDLPIILSRGIWLREMTALAEGRPLTQWQTPPFP